MLAAVWYGKEDIRVEDWPSPPPPGRGQVQVRVHFCGICGSDLREYKIGPVSIPIKPHPVTGRCAPLILGHEFAGEVQSIGSCVEGIKKGDRVCVLPLAPPCGSCVWCKKNLFHFCKQNASLGLRTDGAFTESLNVPASCCFILPQALTLEDGALVEPLATALHAVLRARLVPGEDLLIVGAGPVGLSVLLASRALGAKKIVIAEPNSHRRTLALAMGAHLAIDTSFKDFEGELIDSFGETGPDLLFECVGRAEVFPLAVKWVRKGGRTVILGSNPQPSQFVFREILSNEKEIIGAVGYTCEFPIAIGLMADGRLPGRNMVTGIISLEEIVEKGFRELIRPDTSHGKILVRTQKTI